MDYFDRDTDISHGDEFQDVEDLLDESQEDKRQRLRNELERIDRLLEERDRIHEDAVNELESKLDWYVERLKTLYKQHRGKRGKRDKVKSRIEEFYRDIREEKRMRWRDRQELKMERREVLRELEEMSDDSLADRI